MIQYSQDNEEKLVGGWGGDPGIGGYGPSDSTPGKASFKWMDSIFPYIKSVDVFHCPDDSGGLISGVSGTNTNAPATGKYVPYYQLGQAGQPPTPNQTYYGSYSINSYDFNGADFPNVGPGNNPGGGGSYSLAQLQAPATTVWVTDGAGSYTADCNTSNVGPTTIGSYPGIACVGNGPPSLNDNSPIVFRHGGPDLSNVLYCDGHAKSVRQSVLLQKNAAGFYYNLTMQGS
jgi:prepilin-type processing-associated H-X9-DG protein